MADLLMKMPIPYEPKRMNRFNQASNVNRKGNHVTTDVTNVNTQNTLIQDWIERNHETVEDNREWLETNNISPTMDVEIESNQDE